MEPAKSIKHDWALLALKPFRSYMLAAPILIVIWNLILMADEDSNPTRLPIGMALAVGVACCALVFVLASIIHFCIHRRELIFEDLLFAAIAFLIWILTTPFWSHP